MGITNENKLSLSIALAIISDEFGIGRINIKQAGNLNCYMINSCDEELSYFINFNEKQDYDEMFRKIIAKSLKGRFPSKRVPTLDELEDENFALKKVTDFINSYYFKDTDAWSLSDQRDDFDRITSDMMSMCDFGEEMNKLSAESTVVGDAILLVDKTLIKRYDKGIDVKPQDLMNLINTRNKDNAKFQSDLLKTYPFLKDEKIDDIDEDLEKEIAKVLTYNVLYKDLSTDIDPDKTLGNYIFFDSMFDNNQKMQFILHDRVSLKEDIEKYKDDLYTEIISRDGIMNPEDYDIEDKESLAFDAVMDNIKDNPAYLLLYKKALASQSLNWGRNQRIMGAIALNVISALGLSEDLTKMPDLEGIDSIDASDIFEENYNLIDKKPTLAIQIINSLIRDKKIEQAPSHKTFEEYIKQTLADLDIHVVNDLKNAPAEVQDIVSEIMDMLGEDEDYNDIEYIEYPPYDPTIEYPYPENNDDDFDEDDDYFM